MVSLHIGFHAPAIYLLDRIESLGLCFHRFLAFNTRIISWMPLCIFFPSSKTINFLQLSEFHVRIFKKKEGEWEGKSAEHFTCIQGFTFFCAIFSQLVPAGQAAFPDDSGQWWAILRAPYRHLLRLDVSSSQRNTDRVFQLIFWSQVAIFLFLWVDLFFWGWWHVYRVFYQGPYSLPPSWIRPPPEMSLPVSVK